MDFKKRLISTYWVDNKINHTKMWILPVNTNRNRGLFCFAINNQRIRQLDIVVCLFGLASHLNKLHEPFGTLPFKQNYLCNLESQTIP